MAQYNYSGIDKSGKRKRESIEALNEETALEVLQNRGIYIIEISEASNVVYTSKRLKVKLSEISLFARQISTLLAAGVNILTAIEVMEDQSDNKRFKAALNDVRKKVEQGTALSQAMRDNPSSFPDLLCTMIEAGEMTGNTDGAFDKMAEYYDKENKMRQKIVNATIYPSILVTVSTLAIGALMIFAIPQFLKIFEDMQIPLPLITKIVVGIGSALKSYWYIFVGIVVLVIVSYKMYYSSSEGGVNLDRLKLKIPVFGEILTFAAIARFARTLSSLIEAGVPTITAVEVTKKVVINKYMMKKIDGLSSSIRSGESLSENLKGIDVIPRIFPIMVKTGEDSGKVDYMLLKAAELYEGEVDLRVSRINTIIEPVIIVFLALILGGIMAAVMLPMFTLYGNM